MHELDQTVDYELILRSIGEGVNVLDAFGRIAFVNPAAATMLGFTTDELVGREQHALIHHSRADGSPYADDECPILASIREGSVRREDGDVFWRKDGTSFPVDYIVTPIQREGAVLGAVVAFRDVSDRQRVAALLAHDEEQKRLMESLSRMNRELDEFAYVASHDLRAPLRAIATLASWIEEDTGPRLTDESRQHLVLLRSRVHRMEALIDGILQYSRAGRVRDRVERVAVDALLTDVIQMLSVPAAATITVDAGMPTLDTERLPLQQVFQNLLHNALKHSGRADTSVRVSVREEDKFYQFTVADNGPGIPPQFHAKVWEIFQTLHPRDQIEGAGIGLALVKKNVESRGGRVWLESAEAQGARFHFLWPKSTGQEGE